jgi:uncharacterized protein (TIGR03067 family)
MRRYALMVLTIGWLVAAAGLVAAADTAQEEAIKKDREKYEGVWRVVSLEVNGDKAADGDAQRITVANLADGTWVVRVDGEETSKGASQIDPTKNPKTIDFVATGGEIRGQTFLGIYEIDGNSRKLCFAPPGKDRPVEFSSKSGSMHVLVVFRREKE